MTPSRTARRLVLLASVVVVVACLGIAAAIVALRGAGDGLGERLESLQADEDAASGAVKDREALLALSRQFAERFNTYDASMLDAAGHLPEYAAVADLMTPKFGEVFADNVGFAEQNVAQTGAASAATVYAVGVASQDGDSAEVLVAGTVELSYPYPDDTAPPGDEGEDDESGDDEPRVSTGPQRFRFQIAVVKIDGEWLVDDVDDIDDGLPPFSQPSIPEDGGATPPIAPSDGASEPSGSATTEPSEEGQG